MYKQISSLFTNILNELCPAGKGLWGSWYSVLRDMLCLSPIRCACPQCDVVVLDTPYLSAIRCAFPKYAVPALNTLSWPFAVPVPIRNRILTLIPLFSFSLISKGDRVALPWSIKLDS